MKTVFHVVNSVKGGSGKSTVSLLLASYFIHKKKEKAYIVDLDLQGTCWEKNYNRFFDVVSGQEKIHLNDLMYDFSNNITKDFLRYLNVLYQSELSVEHWKIPVCVANPDMRGIDEVELDLFENAIYKLVNRIVEREESQGSELVHIVFDMPPSKEKHSEKILNHLLLDKSSFLNSNFPYYVCLYMVSECTPAHIELNKDYIRFMISDKSYSNAITEFINYEKKNSYFHFCLILNDVSNVEICGVSLEDVAKTSELEVKNSINFTTNDGGKEEIFKHVGSLKHMKLVHKKQILNMYKPKPDNDVVLTIDGNTMDTFETCINQLKL